MPLSVCVVSIGICLEHPHFLAIPYRFSTTVYPSPNEAKSCKAVFLESVFIPENSIYVDVLFGRTQGSFWNVAPRVSHSGQSERLVWPQHRVRVPYCKIGRLREARVWCISFANPRQYPMIDLIGRSLSTVFEGNLSLKLIRVIKLEQCNRNADVGPQLAFAAFPHMAEGFQGGANTRKSDDGEGDRSNSGYEFGESGPPVGFSVVAVYCLVAFFGGWGLDGYAVFCVRGRYRRIGLIILAVLIMCSGFAALFWWGILCDRCNGQSENCASDENETCPFHANTVTQKYLLTSTNYCNTLIARGNKAMANILSTDKQVAVISALAEGSGIRQIERITGVHRDTIMRLSVRVGKGCAGLLDAKMRNLYCNHLQFDEVWGFIGKKERHCTSDDSPEVGDVWTFCAIDSDTKLVPAFRVGKRDAATANAFVADVASRLKNRVQISSDALRAYVDAVEMAFGANVDFAQIVKTYVHDESQTAERKYSAPEFVIEEKKAIAGFPDMRLASTSHIERLNGTTRLHMRRLTRLTYAFSKKRANFEAAVALHFAYYNFVKRHNSLRCTPAMAAGIERNFWSVRDLVGAAA